MRQFKDLYEMLAKVNVNLPLLDVIQNVPAYVKFFKELASTKRKFGDNEKVLISEVASTTLPQKECDPGSFIIKITLGNGRETSGMLDLGAGINLMPYSIFRQLDLGELKPTRMCLQLADRSLRYPKGIIEDILVRVGTLIVPVDFMVLDVGEVSNRGSEHTILLGRPFMATTNTLIDVKNGRITLTVLGETVAFSMDNTRTPSSSFGQCSFVDEIDNEVQLFHINALDESFDEGELDGELNLEEEGVVDLMEVPKQPELK
ncbi:retropepsin-like aspartic protease, partial [Clostridioides difficile]|uniref:retropepsin-like aspartic protease n=1 Tax=Clostridioides difficile TaxID=1496 RepID=UPI0021139FD0